MERSEVMAELRRRMSAHRTFAMPARRKLIEEIARRENEGKHVRDEVIAAVVARLGIDFEPYTARQRAAAALIAKVQQETKRDVESELIRRTTETRIAPARAALATGLAETADAIEIVGNGGWNYDQNPEVFNGAIEVGERRLAPQDNRAFFRTNSNITVMSEPIWFTFYFTWSPPATRTYNFTAPMYPNTIADVVINQDCRSLPGESQGWWGMNAFLGVGQWQRGEWVFQWGNTTTLLDAHYETSGAGCHSWSSADPVPDGSPQALGVPLLQDDGVNGFAAQLAVQFVLWEAVGNPIISGIHFDSRAAGFHVPYVAAD